MEKKRIKQQWFCNCERKTLNQTTTSHGEKCWNIPSPQQNEYNVKAFRFLSWNRFPFFLYYSFIFMIYTKRKNFFILPPFIREKSIQLAFNFQIVCFIIAKKKRSKRKNELRSGIIILCTAIQPVNCWRNYSGITWRCMVRIFNSHLSFI